MQHDAAEDLHVVGDHVPDDFLPAGHPLLAQHTAAGFLHDGKRLGQQLIELTFDALQPFFFEVVQLFVEPLALFGREFFDLGVAVATDVGHFPPQARFDLGLARLDVGHGLFDASLELVGLGAQLFVAERLNCSAYSLTLWTMGQSFRSSRSLRSPNSFFRKSNMAIRDSGYLHARTAASKCDTADSRTA